MQKKALIISEVFHPEDFIINDLVDDWLDKGYQLDVLTRNPSYPYGKVLQGFKNRLYSKSTYKGANVHRIFVFPGYQSRLFIKMLNYLSYVFLSFWVLLFKGRHYNKVFIYQTGPLTNALSAVVLKSLFRYRITIWSQDLWPETVYAYGLKKTRLVHFFLSGLVRYIYKRCDEVLISCKGFEKGIQELISGKKTVWIPNWPLVDGYSDSQFNLPGEFNFTFAGNIGKVQNLDKVIKAFKTIEKEYPKAWLNIVGDGSFLEELKELARHEEVKQVNFTGRKPLAEMPSYFAASDVLIISLVDVPLYEIMIPSKFQTYLTAQKPIFAIMKGEVVAMVDDYELGFSAAPSSVKDIEKGFKKFLNLDNDQMNKFASNSLELLQEQFSESKIKDQIDNRFWNTQTK